MTMKELCEKICLQEEITAQVLDFSSQFDFEQIKKYILSFRDYAQMKDALSKLQNQLGYDKDNIKILSCMLYGAIEDYNFYMIKGIDENIFFDTMKCFTRFIDECFKITGNLAFDREWWTTRQVGCHLFRIGALEYEIKHLDTKIVIGIHIPSDTNFSKECVDTSLARAAEFFNVHFPEFANCEYRCHSWLLSQELKNMLPESSNIINFQQRFTIINQGEEDTEFIKWLFNTDCYNYSLLPERTSLQKAMKKYLLSGGTITTPYGVLKKSVYEY